MTNEIKNPEHSHDVSAHGDHERTDVNVRGIVWFTVMFALALLVVHFVLVGYIGMERTPTMEQQSQAIAIPETFQGPNLQENPHADLRRFKSGQREQLSEYRWVDAKQRVVAISIDEAIHKLAAEGLNAAEARVKHSADPTESGDKSDKKISDGASDGKTSDGKSPGEKP